MEDVKLPSNATSSIAGTFHQFYIALEKCFMLHDDETIYIEQYGDVTISSKSQIEIKKYTDSLTDTHENIWKTLKNWLHPQFDHALYKDLILLTTQTYGTNCSFKDWATLNADQKYNTLTAIKSEYDKQKTKSEEKVKLIEFVLSNSNKTKLLGILSKFEIITNTEEESQLYDSLKTQYARHVLSEHKNDYINSLFGFIISVENKTDLGWEITCENFNAKVIELSDRFRYNTVTFPAPTESEYQTEDYKEHLFVRKIKDIEYGEVINDAISTYVITANMITTELRFHKVPQSAYNQYNDDLARSHNAEFRTAKRNCNNENYMSKSKDFYDKMLAKAAPKFHKYESTPLFFKEGMIHLLTNDSEKNIKWKLSDE